MSTEDRKLSAIVFTDICGFTELMSKDETKAMSLLDQQRSLLKPIIKNFNGEWLKEIGDGVLVSFPSAVRAVTCSLEIQRILAHNSDLTLRIGIHIGDVIRKDGDVFGDGVNIASRLEPLAEPGGICVSERVHEDIKNKPDIRATFQEEQLLKGVEKPIRVYSIYTEMGTPDINTDQDGGPKLEKNTPRISKMPFLFAGIVIGLLITVFALNKNPESNKPEEMVFYTGERLPVAIADFENNTGDATLDGLSGLLITSLEQSNYLSVLTRSRMNDILKQIGKSNINTINEDLGREICKTANIQSLILASISQFGDLYSVDLKILDVNNNEYLFTTNIQSEGKKSIPSMIDDIAKYSRSSLAEKKDVVDRSQTDIAKMTTDNLDAFKYYDLGEKAMFANQWKTAIEFFEEAVEYDTSFAQAYYMLAYSHKWFAKESLTDFYIEKANAFTQNIPEKERLYIEALAEKLSQKKIKLLEKIIEKFPNEKLAYFDIGDTYYHDGYVDRSIPYFEDCLDLDPTFEFSLQHKKWALNDLRLYDRAIKFTAESSKLFPDKSYYKTAEVKSYLDAGMVETFFEKILQLEKDNLITSGLKLYKVDGYIARGDYKSADSYLKSIDTDKDIKERVLIKTQSLAVHRGDLERFLKVSEELLNTYVSNNNFIDYANELGNRATVLNFPFNLQQKSINVLNELEKMLDGPNKKLDFVDMGLFTRRGIIQTYQALGLWDRVEKYREDSMNFYTEQMQSKGIKAKQDNNIEDAIKFYEDALNDYNITLFNQHPISYELGICYMINGDYENAIKCFDKLKDSTDPAMYNVRQHYHPLYFLQSGLANFELENYRLAKSNLETFLKIWSPASDSLEHKILARNTIAKIEKVIS